MILPAHLILLRSHIIFSNYQGKGDLSQVKIVGKELAIRNSQTPRFDFHFQIDFTKAENEDAELFIEIWDYDKSGDDDIISRVELDSQDIRERACTTIATRKQVCHCLCLSSQKVTMTSLIFLEKNSPQRVASD